MSTLRNRWVLVVSCLACLVFVPSANAAFISSATGSSPVFTGSDITSYVNFAVYDNPSGGNWRNDIRFQGNFPTISGSVVPFGAAPTGSERYVYFYSVFNTKATNASAVSLTIPGFYSNLGYLNNDSFQDYSVQLSTPGGYIVAELDSSNELNDGAAFTTASPSSPGLFGLTTATLPGQGPTNPAAASPVPGGGRTFTLNLTVPSAFSSVFFLTSDLYPVAGTGSITGRNMEVFAATPEPSSLALLAVGLAVATGAGLRRRVNLRRSKSS